MTLPKVNTTLLWVAIAVLLTLQVEGCLHNSKPDSAYKKEIAAKDKEIEKAGQERDVMRRRADSLIVLLMAKDTVLVREYKTNTVKYEKIPVIVGNLSNDELRRAVSNY
jgi:hypothetical protein